MNRMAFTTAGGRRVSLFSLRCLLRKLPVHVRTMMTDSLPARGSKYRVKPAIDRIRSVLQHESFTSGTYKVPVNYCDLYYKTKTNSLNLLNLAQATDEQLALLVSACDTTPSGQIGDNGLPLKLDPSQFSMPFELSNTNILHKIQQDLVETDVTLRRRIRTELYKLDIYEKGTSIKSQQDIPRTVNMFGSLVIIFPTPHEGGHVTLSSGDEKWTLDNAKMLRGSTPDSPEVAYVAFCNDTIHEILPATSGRCITLTYNLYLEPSADIPVTTNGKYDAVRSALQDIVNDPVAFPADGILCFGLAHNYPVRRKEENDCIEDSECLKYRLRENGGMAYSLAELYHFLKGNDALIYRVCKDLGLHVTIKAYYAYNSEDYIDEKCSEAAPGVEEHFITNDFIEECNYEMKDAQEMYQHPLKKVERFVGEEEDEYRVVWVTKMSTRNRVRTPYVTKGDEAYIDYATGDVCFVVQRTDPELEDET